MQGHHHQLRFSHRSSAYEKQGHSFESLCIEHLSRYPNLFAKLTQIVPGKDKVKEIEQKLEDKVASVLNTNLPCCLSAFDRTDL